MNTVIEVTYTNYTENVIVTEDNHDQVIEMLTSDKDILDYKVVVLGEVDIEDFSSELLLSETRGKNVGLVRRLQTTLNKMENKTYFRTDKEAISHRSKIKNLKNNIYTRINNLTNLERLYI